MRSPILPRGNRGFTLIEVMLVVAIMGVIAALISPLFLQNQTHGMRISRQIEKRTDRTLANSFVRRSLETASISILFQHLPVQIRNCAGPYIPCVRKFSGERFEPLAHPLETAPFRSPSGESLDTLEFFRDRDGDLNYHRSLTVIGSAKFDLQQGQELAQDSTLQLGQFYATWPLKYAATGTTSGTGSNSSPPFVIARLNDPDQFYRCTQDCVPAGMNEAGDFEQHGGTLKPNPGQLFVIYNPFDSERQFFFRQLSSVETSPAGAGVHRLKFSRLGESGSRLRRYLSVPNGIDINSINWANQSSTAGYMFPSGSFTFKALSGAPAGSHLSRNPIDFESVWKFIMDPAIHMHQQLYAAPVTVEAYYLRRPTSERAGVSHELVRSQFSGGEETSGTVLGDPEELIEPNIPEDHVIYFARKIPGRKLFFMSIRDGAPPRSQTSAAGTP